MAIIAATMVLPCAHEFWTMIKDKSPVTVLKTRIAMNTHDKKNVSHSIGKQSDYVCLLFLPVIYRTLDIF